MRRFFAYSIIALLSLCAACTRGDDQVGGEKIVVLELNNDKVSVSPDGGVFEVIVRASNAWTLKSTPGGEWCEPAIVAGEANMSGVAVSFYVDMTYDSRETIFWFESKGVSRQLVVSQKAKAVIFPDENNHFDVPAEGAKAELAYDSTYPCTVIIPDDAKSWVEKVSTRALESHVIELNIKANNTYAPRETVVQVVMVDNDEVYAEYTISQEQNDALIAGEDKTFNVESEGAKVRIDFKANVEWDVIIAEEGEEWISVAEDTRALSDEYVELVVAENEEYSPRSATVKVVSLEDNTLFEVYTINQAQKDAILISENQKTVSSEGATVEIEFDTNVDYDIVIPEDVDWITLVSEVETRVMETKSVILAVTANEGYDSREAVVRFVKKGDSSVYVDYTITQLQKDAILPTEESVEISVESIGDQITISYQTNVDCEVIIPADVDWITLGEAETRALRTESKVLNVATNSGTDARTAVVKVVMSGNEELAVEYTITQKQMDVILTDENSFTVGAAGGSVEIEFDTNVEYDILIVGGAEEWISLAQQVETRAMETKSAVLLVAENVDYDGREGVVRVVMNGNSDLYVDYFISQLQKDALQPSEEGVEISVSSAGDDVLISYLTNVDCEVIIPEDVDWVTLNQTRGLEAKSAVLAVAPNTTYSSRSAVVEVVSVDGLMHIEYTISQAQLDAIHSEQNTFTVAPEGGNVEIEFATNVDYDIVIEEGAEWITLVQEIETRALEAKSMVLAVAANEGYDGRQATVRVQMKGSDDVYAEYLICQLQKDAVEVGDSGVEFKVASTGDVVTISYLTNVDCEVIIPEDVDWITLNDAVTRGLEAKSAVLNIAANATYDSRSAVVKVVSVDGKLTVEYTIVQAQMDAILFQGDKIVASVNGCSGQIQYMANVDNEVVIPAEAQEWITIAEPEETRGLEEYSFTLIVAANPTFEAREATITIKGGDLSRDILVLQEGKRLGVETVEYDLDFAATTIDVVVDTNIEYDVILSEGCTWIEAEKSDEGLVLNVLENATIYDRSATVTLRHGEKDVVISVVQRGDEGVLEIDEEYVVSGLATSVVVEFKSNFDYEVIIPEDCDWIVLPQTRAAVNDCSVTFVLTTNPKVYGRSADITFADAQNSISKVVRVIQEGSPLLAVVEVADNEIVYVSSDGNVVSPKSSIFGSTFMLENIYEDGYGRIIFSDAVTKIGDGVFEGCATIEQIVIPQSVEVIGAKAFSGCSSIADITIPETVTTIDSAAFKGCSALAEVVFDAESHLDIIGSEAFAGCSAITSFTLPNSVQKICSSAFSGCSSLKEFNVGEQTSLSLIDNRAFENCVALESFSLSQSLETIGDRAFMNCRSLVSVTLPDSVQKIGGSAFYGCSLLENVALGNGVTTIGNSAFSQCVSMRGIVLPESLTIIGNNAFGNCQGLLDITIPASVTKIAECAFLNCTKLERANIGAGVQQIGLSAFSNCSSLMEVTFAEGSKLEHIYKQAFNGCRSLGSIVLPEGVTTIDDSAFNGCVALQSFVLPSSVTTIGKSVFMGCTGELTINANVANATSSSAGIFYGSKFSKVIVGGDVTAIGDYAFYGCKSIAEVVFGEAVETIGNYSFYGCTGITSLSFPRSVKSIGEAAFKDCNAIAEVTFAEESLLEKIGKEAFSGCSNLENINLPEGVKELGENAFSGCSNTVTVVVPASATEIGKSAFKDCTGKLALNVNTKDFSAKSESIFYGSKFTDVVVGEGVTTIGKNTFAGCSTIKSVEFGDAVALIGDYAFNGCSAIQSVVFGANLNKIGNSAFNGCSSLGSLTIPEGVQTIDKNAFNGCSSIASLTIPQSVVTIGDASFRDCSAIVDVVFAEGALINTIGKEAFSGCSMLGGINLPEGVQTIGEKAFSGCSNTVATVVPASAINIGKSAFKDCAGTLTLNANVADSDSKSNSIFNGSKYTNVVVGAGVVAIGNNAFVGCTTIQSVALGEDVESLGDYAFSGCSAMQSVELSAKLATIGNSAFDGCKALASVAIPASVSTLGKAAFMGCTGLVEATFAEETVLDTISEELFSGCSSLKGIAIPASIATIGDNAFYGCGEVVSVIFADNEQLGSIGSEAFAGCVALESISIPASVKSIGDSAFKDDGAIAKIEFAEASVLETIGNEAFRNCAKVRFIDVPNSVTTLGKSAFNGCDSLVSAILGTGMQTVGDSAFYGCDRLSIVYSNAVTPPALGDEAFDGCAESLTIYVPKNSLASYKSEWSDYVRRIVVSELE